jgi:hypothetical protein
MQNTYLDESTNGSCEYPIVAISKRWASWQLPAINPYVLREREKTRGGRWLTICGPVPVELVGGDGRLRISAAAGNRDLGGGEARWRHILPASWPARPGAARGGRREARASVAAVLCWWRGRAAASVGHASDAAGEFDAAPRIAGARAGEQDISAGEKLGRLGFGWVRSRRWTSQRECIAWRPSRADRIKWTSICGRPPRVSKFYFFVPALLSTYTHACIVS